LPAVVNVPVNVIIVNFNAGEALARCLKSVLAQEVPVRVTVIDNASTDGSAAQAQAEFADCDNVRFVENEGNPGFAPAVNKAVLLAEEGEVNMDGYLLILNPDCELREGALGHLVDALARDPSAALAGPAVQGGSGELLRGTLRRFPDPWRSFLTVTGLWRLGRRLPGFQGVEENPGAVTETRVAEAVSGACMLVRKSSFRAAGGMDEGYLLHCEDLDLMYRLRQSGGYCVYVPAAHVFHRQGLSSASRPAWVHWQKHRGMQRFFRKFQARDHGFLVRALVTLGIWLRFAVTLPLALLRH
jgi:hypothetical protein